MNSHDLSAFVDGLGQKLSARSRHVCAFLGAGSSKACGLPDVQTLQNFIESDLPPAMRDEFAAQLRGRNLEQALSRIRRISSLLADSDGAVDGLSGVAAAELDSAICRALVARLTTSEVDLGPVLRFAWWAGQADYALPVELFTVNYDLLLETALERVGVPYFDGFIGSVRSRFRNELVEAGPEEAREWLPSFLVRLWKLHGSVNWQWDEGKRVEVVRLGVPVADGSPAAIYPSDAKYDESRRVPFVVLQDRFRRALQTPESLVLIAGYSWGDEHLNELLFDAAQRRPRSEFVSFSFGDLPDELATKAEVLPNLQAVGRTEAVLAGVRAAWSDHADTIPDVWADKACLLGDFRHLAAFLARSSTRRMDTDPGLAALLATLQKLDV